MLPTPTSALLVISNQAKPETMALPPDMVKRPLKAMMSDFFLLFIFFIAVSLIMRCPWGWRGADVVPELSARNGGTDIACVFSVIIDALRSRG